MAPHVNIPYPNWFVDLIFDSDTKELAKSGSLFKTAKIEFCCSMGHHFISKVGDLIGKGMTKKGDCPFCNKLKKVEKRNYPDWFIKELVNTEDKEKANTKVLRSTDIVTLKCSNCGYVYTTKVCNRLCIKTGNPKCGCRECARKKHSEDRKKYIQENYNKVVDTNRKNVESQKLFYTEHPEKLVERGEKHSLWFKEHPEKIESFLERMNLWRKENPDKVEKIKEECSKRYQENPDLLRQSGEKVSLWYKNNPDKVKEKAQKYIIKCKTTNLRKRLSDAQKENNIRNPDLVKQRGEKVSLWYRNNPDKVAILKEKHKLYMENHTEIKERISKKIKEFYKNKEWKKNKINDYKKTAFEKRVANLSESFLLSLSKILHPEDYNNLLNTGVVTSQSKVRVKCPRCGVYSSHLLYNFCSLNKNIIESVPYCTKCLGELSSSKQEKEIKDFICSLYNGVVIENSKEIIPPYELDLFYPEKNIAIEYHGAYWHSEDKKRKTLHFQKFFLCKQKGIRLISIFSQDWEYKKEKILSLLKNIFFTKTKIYARQCVVKEIEREERKQFLDSFHFDCDSKYTQYSYGLFHNNVLVSVMSFGKLRGNNPLHNKEGFYEILRFANKENLEIVGGASKLFSYFVKNKQPNYVLTYSDNDFFSGEVYRKLGFSFVSYGEKNLDYQWVKYKSVLNRYSCTVENLLKKYPHYKDIKIEGSIEDYIMKDLGYLKVYRCGNSKWELFCK